MENLTKFGDGGKIDVVDKVLVYMKSLLEFI